jgi:cytochrome c peroxidase
MLACSQGKQLNPNSCVFLICSALSPTGKYRTTPLGGLFARAKGGFFHDGRFAKLNDVVNHYNNHFSLNLTASEKANLVEYLESL